MMAGDARVWVISVPGRPVTENAFRRMHFHARSDYSLQWKHAAEVLAREAKIPSLESMHIIVRPFVTRRPFPDVAACASTVKACIDGLVDAKVVPDDDPSHHLSTLFLAAAIGESNCLRIEVHDHVGHEQEGRA